MASETRESCMFMKMSGKDLKGESEDSKHKDWIEIDSWECSYSQPGTPKKGGGTDTIDRARHDPFKVSKKLDKSSAALKKACWKGEQIATVMIECFRSADETASITPYLTIELSDVMIAEYSLKSGNNELPDEDLDLTYTKIKFTYTPMNKQTNKFEGKTEASHELTANTVT